MDLKRIILALAVLAISTTVFAAEADNAAPPAPDGKSSLSDVPSYFEGVWTGKWPWGTDGVEISVTIRKKYKNGLYGTTYTWGSGQRKNGTPIKPGSVKAWGKELGDRFLIEWNNKGGEKSSITLVKEKESSVKAIFDSDGTLAVRDRSYLETYLHRK